MSDSIDQNARLLMSKVADRFQKVEQRATTIVSQLERQKSVQDSLDVTGEELQKAGSAIAELAQEANRATDEFKRVIRVLRTAVDVLDPSALKSRLDSISQNTDRVEVEVSILREQIDAEVKQNRVVINENKARVEADIKSLRELFDSEVRQNRVAINENTVRIEEEVKILREQLEAEVKHISVTIAQSAGLIDTSITSMRKHIDAEVKGNRVAINQNTGRIETEIKNLHNHINAELADTRAAINGSVDSMVERLRPRSIWEGMFGRRKE